VTTQKSPAIFEQGVTMQEWLALSNSENEVQKWLVLSLRASFKRAYSALLEFAIE
jgi:hypothetical protein